ncbi:MAG: hypothetical protein ACJ8FY_19380 [Gemmataceae bacterium]
MPAKRKSPSSSTKKPSGGRPKAPYTSLAQGPTPAQRRQEVKKRLQERGLTPIKDFDRYLQEVSDFWPQDESCDEFLVWLRNLRQESSS